MWFVELWGYIVYITDLQIAIQMQKERGYTSEDSYSLNQVRW